jgi:hypothetical protein
MVLQAKGPLGRRGAGKWLETYIGRGNISAWATRHGCLG